MLVVLWRISLCLTHSLSHRINDPLRHAERKLVFNVDGLRRFGKSRRGRFQPNVPHHHNGRAYSVPVTVPKYYTVAREVATMDLLRSSGLPIPNLYGHSPESDNWN